MDKEAVSGENVVHSTGCCCFPGLGIPRRTAGEPISQPPLQCAPTKENAPPPQQASQNIAARRTSENVATVYDLPPGWRAVTSRSRPDRTAFLNEFTGERISWVPTEPASTVKGEVRRAKRRSKVNNDKDSVQSSESGNTLMRASFDRRGSERTSLQ